MSSTVRHYSFKDIQWTRRRPSLFVVLIALLIGAIVQVLRTHALLIASVYTAHGVVLQVVRIVRRRVASRHA